MKRVGFTLIELLVVIGIISLLMTIVLTISHGVREQARSTACQSNIRQQCLKFFCYATDNDRFPMAWDFSAGNMIGDLNYDLPATWWFQSIGLDPQVSDAARGLLQCPSKHLGDSGDLKNNILWGNYGSNWSVCASRKFVLPKELRETTTKSLSPANIKNPGEVFLVGDSGYAAIGWHHTVTPLVPFVDPAHALATSYLPGLSVNKQRELRPVQRDDAERGRHPNRSVNVGYVDGHEANKPADELLVTQTSDGIYTKRTPLWKPR